MANLAKQSLDETRQTPGAHQNEPSFIDVAAGAGDSLTHLAGNYSAFQAVVHMFWPNYARAIAQYKALQGGKVDRNRLANAVALLESSYA